MPSDRELLELQEKLEKLERENAELKRANDLLSSEKNTLDEILDTLPGTFYIWDDSPKLIRWNRKHQEITEHSAEEYESIRPNDFFDETEHHAIEAAFNNIFTEGEVTVEATLVTKSGKRIPHVYTAVRTLYNGKPVLMGFGIDISQLKATEQRLQQALSEMERLKRQLEAECEYLEEEIKTVHDFGNIIGESEVMKYVFYSMEQIAASDGTILILGESGTGKELIARAIHHGSRRKERPLVKVDCSTLPANLIESELFGHEKGAFSGAVERRVGRFELANRGTIFLDEIGELPLELQGKLLRVLQDGEYERLGSSKVMHTDVRVIAATNRNLEADVELGLFRTDLWYRLNVLPLSLPPLRERKEDIPLLVNWIINKVQRRLGKNIKMVPNNVMQQFTAYSWPGNVRELENVIERAIIFCKGSKLQLEAPLQTPSPISCVEQEMPMKSLLEMDKEHILKALTITNWNVSGKDGAAEILGLNSSTLRGKMRKFGIHRPSGSN